MTISCTLVEKLECQVIAVMDDFLRNVCGGEGEGGGGNHGGAGGGGLWKALRTVCYCVEFEMER